MAISDETSPGRRDDSLSRTTDDLKTTATQATDTAKHNAAATLNENRKTAADEIEGMAHAVRTAASDLQEQDREGLSHYVTEMADSVSALASGLRKKSVDELMHDAENIARRNPALFIGGSIAIGLGLARFAKASSHRHSETRTEPNTDTHMHSHSSTHADTREPKADTSLPTGFTTAEGMGRTKSTGNGNGNGLGNNSDNRLGGVRYE